MGLLNNNIELTGIHAPGKRVSNLRVLGFLLVCMLPFALAWNLMGSLFRLVLDNDTFSQIPLIPLVSIFLVYEHRKAIFPAISTSWNLGAALIAPGALLLGAARLNLLQLGSTNTLSLLIFATFLIWLGAFALFFGSHAFRAACFPLLFLLFMVPIPEPLLSKTIYFLQAGSSDMTEIFFGLARVPYHREGFVFDLPGIAIRVAEECSGIRSTLALLITTVLASYIFLKSSSRRLILCTAVIPTAIFKNGLRIATLSILSIYVNPGFLYGNLHRRGGIVFFVIALLPLALLLKLLQKSENWIPARPADAGAEFQRFKAPRG
jgi:exosortase